MEAVLLAMVLSNIINYFTNAVIAEKYIRYRVLDQMRDVAQILLISLIIGGAVYAIQYYINVNWILIAITYSILYITINSLVKNEVTMLVKNFIKKRC